MKMVKSLLLGSAAGLIAVAGAQAADLPVKAKAVEYVKICSLYGVGYYYIPGTDTCIKIGGYVRWEGYHNAAGGHYPNHIPGGGGALTRHYNSFAMQARFRLTTDVRTQTEYGTLRSYFAAGINTVNNAYDQGPGVGTGIAIERAFIQFAGFTIGRVDTFFAFYNGAAYGLVPFFTDGSSGPAGHNVFAYTWQFGNGLSATLSLEDAKAHDRGVIDLAATGLLPAFSGATPTDSAGSTWPDVVANLRVDQAWGSAQIMGALHQVTARYDSVGVNPQCLAPNTTGCTHPSDEIGWAVGAGLTLKMPWDAKDTLSGVIAYSKGASSYVAYGQSNNWLHKQEVAVGAFNDGVFLSRGVAATNFQSGAIELTEVWGGTIAFEHYWTPALRTSWVFGYIEINYSDEAKRLLTLNNAAGTCLLGGMVLVNNTQCDPDWSMWRLASRTMWNPVANLDVGLEVAYTKLNTSFAGSALVAGANGLQTRIWNIDDQNVWTATMRVQRSFWP
jgi:hypothetical protein